MNKYKLIIAMTLVFFMCATSCSTHKKTNDKAKNSVQEEREESYQSSEETAETHSNITSPLSGFWISLGLFVVLGATTATLYSRTQRQIGKLKKEFDYSKTNSGAKKNINNLAVGTGLEKDLKDLRKNLEDLDQKIDKVILNYKLLDKSLVEHCEGLDCRIKDLENSDICNKQESVQASVSEEVVGQTAPSLYGAPEIGNQVISDKIYSPYKTPFLIHNIVGDTANYTFKIDGEEAAEFWIKDYMVFNNSVLFDESCNLNPKKFEVIDEGSLMKTGDNKWQIVDFLKAKLV